MKVILSPQAQEDLDTIEDPLLSKVIKRLRILADFPELGASMTGPFTGYRATVAGDLFRVVYRFDRIRGRVAVAYIRHCKRGLPC
ncbi:MAG: type II toxin-antitoxin system RelE/ParE family toxin [Elusimicrobiota bacterium]